MPYVVTTLSGRDDGGVDPPSTMTRQRDGSIRRSAVVTSETSVAGDPATASASKPGSIDNRVPVTSDRVTTDRPPTWASGRQASHSSVSGSTSNRRLVATAEASTASWVSTTPFGSPVVPLVATTRASPGATSFPARRDDSSASRAGGGSRGSTGSTASPSDHAVSSAATKASPPTASTATSFGTPGSLPVMNRWLAGARPRTLPAAVVPVVVGTAVASAEGSVTWWRAVAAMVTALAIQIGT